MISSIVASSFSPSPSRIFETRAANSAGDTIANFSLPKWRLASAAISSSGVAFFNPAVR